MSRWLPGTISYTTKYGNIWTNWTKTYQGWAPQNKETWKKNESEISRRKVLAYVRKAIYSNQILSDNFPENQKQDTQTKWKSEVWPRCVSVSLPGWAKADNVVGMFHLKGIVNGSGYKRATLDFYLCLALTFFFFPQSCGWTDFKAQARLSPGIIWPRSLVTLTLWAHTRGSSV